MNACNDINKLIVLEQLNKLKLNACNDISKLIVLEQLNKLKLLS